MRAVVDQLDRLDGAKFLAASSDILVDVPGVPFARLVLGIDPELVAAARQRLTSGAFFDQTGDGAVVADLGEQICVLQRPRDSP